MGIAFTLLFTTGGVIATLLALRVGGGSAVVRWLAGGFLVLAAANLGLSLWPAIAADPAGAARKTGIAAVLALAALGYLRLLRAARRMAGQRRDGP